MGNCRCKCKPPLMPSILYTQGDENVKEEVVEDLKVPDPSPVEATEAIAMATWDGEGGK